ncbi:MAG: ROK family protein [Victivallales bacterium]|jgi:glucokinase
MTESVSYVKNTGSGQEAVLAVDAGGTYFKSALISQDGGIIEGSFLQTTVPPSGSKPEIIGAYEKVFASSFQFAGLHGLMIVGIGISTPGPFDYVRGMSLMDHKFKSIKNIRLREEFAGLDCFDGKMPVVFQQDVHSFLIGEHWAGVIRGADSAAAITLGTGLGFGVMKNSTIVDNGSGGPCVSVFNRPYGNGILEDRISRRGLISQYCKYAGTPDSGIDVHEISRKARTQDDPRALKVFREAGQIMAEELCGIFEAYEIKNLVFGGQISKSFDLFAPSLEARLRELGKVINVMQGANIESSALIGAAKKLFESR